MKVVDEDGDGMLSIELSRRNLTALLAKLDGHPPNSACTLISACGRASVKAVEDAEHYTDRPAGRMNAETEAALRGD